jgi:sulfur-oxidizing protein SoxB
VDRREFLGVVAAAIAAGMTMPGSDARANQDAEATYDAPPHGNVSLLHFTDCHAQLLPIHFREPSVNIGIAGMRGRVPHLVGEALLARAGIAPGTRAAFAFAQPVRARCFSMAAIPGRGQGRRCGPMPPT